MQSIVVTPRNEAEYSLIMQLLEKMRVTAAPLGEKAITRMTMEEYRAMIDSSIIAARNGDVISHKDLKKEMEKW